MTLVTGATAYIGRAAAQELAQRGALVVVNGRNAASAQCVVYGVALTIPPSS